MEPGGDDGFGEGMHGAGSPSAICAATDLATTKGGGVRGRAGEIGSPTGSAGTQRWCSGAEPTRDAEQASSDRSLSSAASSSRTNFRPTFSRLTAHAHRRRRSPPHPPPPASSPRVVTPRPEKAQAKSA